MHIFFTCDSNVICICDYFFRILRFYCWPYTHTIAYLILEVPFYSGLVSQDHLIIFYHLFYMFECRRCHFGFWNRNATIFCTKVHPTDLYTNITICSVHIIRLITYVKLPKYILQFFDTLRKLIVCYPYHFGTYAIIFSSVLDQPTATETTGCAVFAVLGYLRAKRRRCWRRATRRITSGRECCSIVSCRSTATAL